MSISQFTLEESYSLNHGLERVNTLACPDLLTATNAYLFYIEYNDCFDTDEGDMGLDSTVLVDDNITDCDVTDEDQEMIERVRSSFYFPH